MAGAVIDRAWRDVAADDIEAALADLWREIGRRESVARAVMSNLVVFGAARDLPIDEVVARHPARVIRIAHSSGAPGATAAITARAGVVTYGPPQARYGVEQIAVDSSCADASLPSIVRRLVRGDVPTSLWWADDASCAQLPESMIALSRQVLFDSRSWRDIPSGVAAIVPALAHPHVHCSDINWRRLAPVRRAFLHAGDELRRDELQPSNVHVLYRRGEQALAWLLVGWLRSRVQWSAADAPPIEETADADEILAVEVGRGGEPTRIGLTSRQLTVKQRGWPPYTTVVRVEDEAEAVAAELKSLAEDVCLRDALRALAVQ